MFSELTEPQKSILCLALAEYQEKITESIRRCKYALDQSRSYGMDRVEYRENIAKKIVVYEQRLANLNEVIRVVGFEVDM